MKSGLITMLTDFGLKDPYVGVMKGVVLGINPAATVVDITHQVPPGNILIASTLLRDAISYFPKGTVHVAVVDPGVGTQRRPIAVSTDDFFLVGPDNGLFWPLLSGRKEWKAYHLIEERFFLPEVSSTFHGRDIFSPVAAHLSLGVRPEAMGPQVSDLVQLKLPGVVVGKKGLRGVVIRVDRFGNLITNIDASTLEELTKKGAPEVRVGDLAIKGIKRTYGEVPKGEALALLGSGGYLEISVNQGRASDLVGVPEEEILGMAVQVSIEDSKTQEGGAS